MTDKLNKRAGFHRAGLEMARFPILKELELRGVKINPGEVEGR